MNGEDLEKHKERINKLELTLSTLAHNQMTLTAQQAANDKSLNKLYLKLNDHFVVESQLETYRKKYQTRHENTLTKLNSTVAQLNDKLASMHGLHDRATRDLLTPLHNKCRVLEDKDTMLETKLEKTINDFERKTTKKLVSIERMYEYIFSFLVVSIVLIMVAVGGYWYFDL